MSMFTQRDMSHNWSIGGGYRFSRGSAAIESVCVLVAVPALGAAHLALGWDTETNCAELPIIRARERDARLCTRVGSRLAHRIHQ